MRKASSELISVSLVSEVNKGLNKQNSNSSLTSSLSGHSLNNGNGKGPPPPYVQPPQPQRPQSQQLPSRSVSVQGKPAPNSASPQAPTSSISTYANVQFRVKGMIVYFNIAIHVV